jgi:hypothetical protein
LKGPNDGPQPPPSRAVDAMVTFAAGATGPAGPFLSIADQNTGVVRSAVWPHGKERAAEQSRFGPIGPTGPAGPGSSGFDGRNRGRYPMGPTGAG